jgi:hypothetical protein
MSDDPFAFAPIKYASPLSPHPVFEIAIDDKGNPRDCSVSPTRSSSALLATFSTEAEPAYGAEGRATGVLEIRLRRGHAEAGWKLRRDYFREWYASAKSDKEKAQIVTHWEHYQDYHARCHDDRRPSVMRKTFPDKYLPPAEVKLRKDWKDTQALGEWNPEALSA